MTLKKSVTKKCAPVQSQSYITTDGQLASLSRCQAPIWSPWPDFCFLSWQLWVSLTRGWVCYLFVQLLLGIVRVDIIPATGFPSRRLLWLGGLWWRYSNPPPYGRTNFLKIKATTNFPSTCTNPLPSIKLPTYNFLAQMIQKTHFFIVVSLGACENTVPLLRRMTITWQWPLFTEVLPSNGWSYTCLLSSHNIFVLEMKWEYCFVIICVCQNGEGRWTVSMLTWRSVFNVDRKL
jgi:hypothetical protein